MKDLKLSSLAANPVKTKIKIGSVTVGEGFVVMAGPCAVESEEQIMASAKIVKEAGANMLRGGAFKPRTSPYAFQGMGLKGLQLLEKAKREFDLPIVSEVMDPRDVSWVSEYVDILQIGTRNMQNFALLKEAGKSGKAVLLKRGMYSTLEEWLNCAEYILAEGNPNVILCERGIRTHEKYTRNTYDLSAVPALRELTHLPVIGDPSHGTGRTSLIPSMALATVASGADGMMVETHPDPTKAVSDKDQTMNPEQFQKVMRQVRAMEENMKALPA